MALRTSTRNQARRKAALGVAGRVLLIAAFAALGVLCAVLDNTFIGYAPLLLLLAVLACMALYLVVGPRMVSWDETASLPDCRRGDSVDFAVKVANRSPLLFARCDACLYVGNLGGGVDAYTYRSFSLLPRQTADLSLAIRFDHVGRYEAGLHSLVLHDLFGIASRTVANQRRQAVQVLPRIANLSAQLIDDRTMHDNPSAARTMLEEGMDYSSIRDYEAGDPLRLIHWKMTARFGEYLSRVYETQVNPSIDIVMDRAASAEDGEELMCCYDGVVESALSLHTFARRAGIECTIIVPQSGQDDTRLSLGGSDAYPEVLEVLPRLDAPDKVPALHDSLVRLAGQRYGAGSVVVCTACVTPQLVSATIDLRASQRQVLVMAVVAPTASKPRVDAVKRMLAPLDAAGATYVVFSDVSDLEGV